MKTVFILLAPMLILVGCGKSGSSSASAETSACETAYHDTCELDYSPTTCQYKSTASGTITANGANTCDAQNMLVTATCNKGLATSTVVASMTCQASVAN